MENIQGNMTGKYKAKIVAMVCLFILTFSGCGNSSVKNINNTNLGVESNQTTGVNSGEEANSTTKGNSSENQQNNSQYEFLGTWEFSKTLPGYISALSQEQADSFIGKQVVYGSQYCNAFGKSLNNPYYEVSEMALSEFREGNNITDDWGINPKETVIKRIRVYENKEKAKEWQWEFQGFGADVYFVDSRMIMDVGGVYFELKKLENMDNNGGDNMEDTTWLFGQKDLYINGNPILNTTYEEVIKKFGKPTKVSEFKIRPPATEPGFYNYFNTIVYNGFECEFDLGEDKRDIQSTDKVFRFDITSKDIKLDCGLSVGMTTKEVLNKFGDREVYDIGGNENSDLSSIKHVLNSYKPV